MKITARLQEKWQDFKAYRRGERRIAPPGIRGRVYERIAGDGALGDINVRGRPTATLTMTITRADGTQEVVTRQAEVQVLG